MNITTPAYLFSTDELVDLLNRFDEINKEVGEPDLLTESFHEQIGEALNARGYVSPVEFIFIYNEGFATESTDIGDCPYPPKGTQFAAWVQGLCDSQTGRLQLTEEEFAIARRAGAESGDMTHCPDGNSVFYEAWLEGFHDAAYKAGLASTDESEAPEKDSPRYSSWMQGFAERQRVAAE